MGKKAKITRQGDWNYKHPEDRVWDFGGRSRARAPRGKRQIENEETGRVPRATNMENFKQIASEYLPRSGVERRPRPELVQDADLTASTNHNDLIRGNGY